MKQALILILLFFINGCAIKPETNSDYNQYFSIELSDTNDINFKNSEQIIKIQKPVGERFLNTKKIVYTEQKNELYPYAKSFWSEPLASQYVFLLSQSLEKSNLFKGVVTNSSKLSPDLFLESKINSFKHIIRGENSYVEFSVTLNLIAYDELISSKSFHYTKPTQTIDAKGAVWAYSLVFNEFLNELKIWISENLE